MRPNFDVSGFTSAEGITIGDSSLSVLLRSSVSSSGEVSVDFYVRSGDDDLASAGVRAGDYVRGDLVMIEADSYFEFASQISVGSMEGYQLVMPASAQLYSAARVGTAMVFADSFGLLHPLRADDGLILFQDGACAFEPSPVPGDASASGFALIGSDVPAVQFGYKLGYLTDESDVTSFHCKGVVLCNQVFHTIDSGDVSPYRISQA